MRRVIFLVVVGVLTASCGTSGRIDKAEGFALGTVYSISVKGEITSHMRQAIDSVLLAADESMSVFNKGSLLSRLNDNRTDTLDHNVAYCIELARQVSELSGGRYDITVLPLLEAYGFSGGTAERDKINMDSLLQLIGYEKIAIEGARLVKKHPQSRIDLNSVAKGYTVDLVAAALESCGAENYLVDIGGEIFCRGTNAEGKPWKVGIEMPLEGNFVQGAHIANVVRVSDVGMATSGNYRNYRIGPNGEKYTHIIDPESGASSKSNLLSATAIAEQCALADAYGTMFIALGLEESIRVAEQNAIAALFIYSDPEGHMQVYLSEAMKPYFVK